MQRHAIELHLQELERFVTKIKIDKYRIDVNDLLRVNQLWSNVARLLNQKSANVIYKQQHNLQSGFDRQRAVQSANDKLAVINKFKERLESVATILLVTLKINKIDFSKQSQSKILGELLQQGVDHVEQLQKAANTIERILQHKVQTETTAIQLIPRIEKDVKTLDGEAGIFGAVIITLQLLAMYAYDKSRQ